MAQQEAVGFIPGDNQVFKHAGSNVRKSKALAKPLTPARLLFQPEVNISREVFVAP